MAKSFSDVLDEYNQFKVQHPQDDTDLPSFAKQMDEVHGTPTRQEAYEDGHLKRINAIIDSGIAATGLPAVTGGALRMVGEGVDSALGTHIAPTVEDVGRSIPRSLAEGALTMLAPEAEAPLMIKRLMGLGKIVGYADAATQGYAKTDSPVGAAISAGTLGLQNKLLLPTEGGFQGVGGEAADAVKRYLGRDIPTINPAEGLNPLATNPGFSGLTTAQQVLPGAAAIGADVGAVTGVNELSRQASMSVGPNAVPLTDFKDRNPFTAENVAGNLAGALPFGLQAVEGYRSRPRTSAAYEGQAENMTGWLKNRDTSNAEYNGYDYEQPGSAQDNFDSSMLSDVDSTPTTGRFTPDQVGLLHQQIRQNLDAAGEQDTEGQTDLANASRANAHNIVQMLSGEKLPPEMVRTGAETAGEVSRQMPPETPTGFAKFVQDVNGFIDHLNTNTAEFTDEQKNPKTLGEQWNPNARDPAVVQRLQDKGLVPKVTPEYLSNEFHATFNESGDPQFAYHVVVQKVANRLLDNVPAALQAERENPGHVQTQTSPKVAAINEQEHTFYKALTSLPETVKDAAIARTVEISKKPEVYVQGRQMNQVSSWRQAVIQAARSYDPKTDTILLGKKLERVGVHNLVAQDEHGNYLYKPNTSPVRIGEGGKGSTKVRGKTLPEGNLESMVKGGQDVTGDVADEEEFKQKLAEEGIGGSLQAKDEAGLGTGKAATPDILAEPTSQEKSLGDELQKKAKVALKNVDSLTDAQLYNVVRSMFQARHPASGNLIRDVNEPQRVPLVRSALKAAFENFGSTQGVGPEGKSFLTQLAATGRKLGDFTEKKQLDLALRDFFKVQTLVEGGPKGVSNHLARIGQIVSRLTNQKVVDAAKMTGGASRAMVAEHGDLVSFSGPVRLRRWLVDPKGAYTPDSTGAINTKNVIPLLQRLGIGKDELALYKSLGLDDFLSRQRVKVGDIAKWMDEHVPKVEVKKLEPKTSTMEDSLAAEAQHSLEGRGIIPVYFEGKPTGQFRLGNQTLKVSDFEGSDRTYAETFLNNFSHAQKESDAATGRYGVEPKELKDMPGAVDILVRIPSSVEQTNRANAEFDLTKPEPGSIKPNERPLYAGPHFGKEDRNVLASVRGYVETLPTGEKVFHVFEVQSDWGQSQAKIREQSKEHGKYVGNPQDHPLLAVYEQLALKAAIAHAREIGAKYVALSDAETAMMTEGHDRFAHEDIDRLSSNDGTAQIAQEPGMRAAYDVRLPNAMEKLTGEKGKPVEFGLSKNIGGEDGNVGSPIFSTPEGFRKDNITARLYDISKAPEDFAAFGYSRPKPDVTGESIGKNLLVNHPIEGAFSDDVIKSIRARISDVLGKAGYSGTYRDLMTEVAVALAKQGDKVPVDFYRLAGREQGMASVGEEFNRPGRSALGLALDKEPIKGQEVKYVNNLLDTLAHEMSHIDDFVRQGMIAAPDAYSNERLRHLNNLASMAEALQPEERQALLNVLKDGLVPKEYQGNVREASGRTYGSDTPHEFTAEVQSMISRSLLQGKSSGMKTALETLDFAPQEVREFARGTYRTIADILNAVKDNVENPARGYYPDARETLPNDALAATLHSVINEARQGSQLRFADQKLQQARAYTASLSQGAAGNPPVQLTPAMWFRAADDLGRNFTPESGPIPTSMARAAESIQEAGQALLPRSKTAINEGIWMSWFAPFSQRMVAMERQGVPLADDIRKLSEDLQTGVTRLQSAILSPFLSKEADGTIKLDQDNPLIKLVQQNSNGEWRKVLNEVSDWQQRHGAQNMFVADDKGVVTVNKQLQGADDRWNIIKSRLSPDNQQLVMASRVAMDRVGQEAAQRTVAEIDITNRKRVARLMIAMNPRMFYEDAKKLADNIVGGMMRGDVSSFERTTPPEQMQALQTLLGGPDGVLAKFQEVTKLLLNRPGFSTESLPGDYIIKFTNPAGETKFLSGDTQHKANLIAAKLKQEGNTIVGDILHKRDLREYQDFDAPDVLLGKFTDVEQAAWQRATAAVEASVGSEAADAMRTYVPGTASMKDLANKGLNKYLQERQSKVDTSRYDYIDGMLTWAGKLAAGLAYKATSMEKDLILADPRAKAYPEFAGLVNTHFDNLMSPTSEFSRQVKTFAMSYMMGGSFASGIINGTQSTVSLIPTLIQMSKKGIGPVGAYQLLGQAIGDMAGVHASNKWQGIARIAESTDPKTWSLEQSIAALYKRNKEDGGIDHGIIQGDIFSGTDQKTILNAKFGHGDSGNVSKVDMIKNGAYLLAQIGLMPFGWVEKRNNEVALFSAVRQGYADGLRGEELYDYAKKIKVLSTYGGGKANAIGAVSKLSGPYTRSAVAIATTLQSYGFAMTTSYAQYLRDALGRSEGLSPMQRRQATKALGTMLITQVALGGALGLPFAAASLTVLEKLFDIQANAAVRQGLASLGQDDEQGATIAETALNGLGNQMFGLDLSSRVGVSNILGTSSYRGFNLADMAGPVGNIATNMATALNLFATNQPGRAMTELVPNAFKAIMQNSNMQAKYGDSGIRDQSGNLLYQPTPSQSAMTMLGFRPRAVSEKQQAQGLLTLADQRATQQRGQVLDSAAQSLLAGDSGPARKFAMDTKYNDFTTNPRDIYQSVVNRGVDMTTEKDLLASGPSYNEASRIGIASTFGPDVVDRQSEMDRTSLRAQLAARLGAPSLLPQAEDYKRAAIVDSLVKTRGMTRSQALRLVEFLHL